MRKASPPLFWPPGETAVLVDALRPGEWGGLAGWRARPQGQSLRLEGEDDVEIDLPQRGAGAVLVKDARGIHVRYLDGGEGPDCTSWIATRRTAR